MIQYQATPSLKVRLLITSKPKSKRLLRRKNRITADNIGASKQTAAQLKKQSPRLILLKSQMANKFMGKNIQLIHNQQNANENHSEMLNHIHQIRASETYNTKYWWKHVTKVTFFCSLWGVSM